MDTVILVAILTPKEGKTEEITNGMKELAAAVEEKEPGALSYAYFLNEETKKIIVIENYKDMAAVQAHRETEHMAEAMKRSSENLEEPPKIMVLKPLGGFKRS